MSDQLDFHDENLIFTFVLCALSQFDAPFGAFLVFSLFCKPAMELRGVCDAVGSQLVVCRTVGLWRMDFWCFRFAWEHGPELLLIILRFIYFIID